MRKPAYKQHPHHTRLGGVGVWYGCENFDFAGGEKSGALRRRSLNIKAGCRGPYSFGRDGRPERP